MLQLLKNGIFVNAVIILIVKFACVSAIKTEDKSDELYLETFHERLNKLLIRENIIEYVVLGKIKRECNGCTTHTFWSGKLLNSKTLTRDQGEIGGIISSYVAEYYDPGYVPEPQSTFPIPDDKGITEAQEIESESEDLDSDSAVETIGKEKLTGKLEINPPGKALPLREDYFNKDPSLLTRKLCLNGTASQMESGGTVLKFEYMLLSAAFLYVTVVSIVYITVVCRRPKGYQSGIGSITGQDLV